MVKNLLTKLENGAKNKKKNLKKNLLNLFQTIQMVLYNLLTFGQEQLIVKVRVGERKSFYLVFFG